MRRNVLFAAALFRSAVSAVAQRAIGPLALGAFVILAQTAAAADDSHAASSATGLRLLAAAPPAATATTAPSAAPAASPAGSIHDKAGGKPVVIIYDTSSWSGQYIGIAIAVEECAKDFAAKFGRRFNVETALVAGSVKAPKDVDDAVIANGSILGTAYGATVKGQPRRLTTEWTFIVSTRLRDGGVEPWIEAKKESDIEYKVGSDYHAITVSALTDLNDQVIDALAKESAAK